MFVGSISHISHHRQVSVNLPTHKIGKSRNRRWRFPAPHGGTPLSSLDGQYFHGKIRCENKDDDVPGYPEFRKVFPEMGAPQNR